MARSAKTLGLGKKYCSRFYCRNTKFMNEKIHIGKLIHEKLSENDRSIAWLAKNIHCDPSNLNKTLKQNHIDTELLLLISIVMDYDFFVFYSDFIKKRGEIHHETR
jgi:hypothetical protein